MTAQEFVEKFPDQTAIMSNSCEDLACPECGAREYFNVSFHGRIDLWDEGSEDVGDHNWDSDSHIICDCGHEGKVADFTVEGLDKLLAQRKGQKQ